MSAIFNAVKATSLPASPAPHTLYYIKSGSDVRVKGYVTDATGTAFPLGIIDEQDVLGVMLDGFTVGTNAPINSSNTIFTSFRNIQAQLNTLSTAVAGGIKIPLPIDCSTNPNYPAAAAGDSYLVTVGGRIGGASGELVQAGDKIIAQQTNSGGNQATVGTAWYIINGNIDIATTEIAGVTRIATSVEVDAGTDNFAYVTPTTLRGGVRNTPLTGYAVGANTAIAATDSVLGAFGKVQGQLNNKVGGSGSAGQVSFWTGAGVQSGDNGLTFDGSILAAPVFDSFAINLSANANAINLTNPIYGQVVSANTLILDTTAGDILFRPSLTERMRIDSAGNVGIGTSSPVYALDINTSSYKTFRIQSSDDAIVTMGSNVGSSQNWSFGATSVVSGQGSNIFFIGTSSNDLSGTLTKNLVITAAGNVGIGTTAPAFKLDVNGAGRFNGIVSGGTEDHILMVGYNNANISLNSNVGLNAEYSSFNILVNTNTTRNGQGNTALPSWKTQIGGELPNADSFNISRSPAGSFSFTTLFKIAASGAASFSNTVQVGTRANATGNFATFSTAGVLQEQTVAQVRATVVTWTLADW